MTAGVRRRCTGCGRRVWVRFVTDGSGHDVERRDLCACTTSPALDSGLFAAAFQRPASEEAFLDVPRNPMPKHRTTREQREAIRAYVRQLRTEMPELTPTEGLRAVADRFGIEFSPQTFNPTYWHKAEPEAPAAPAAVVSRCQSEGFGGDRCDLPEGHGGDHELGGPNPFLPAEPSANGSHPAVVNRLVSAAEAGPVALQDLAFSEAVHGSPREAVTPPIQVTSADGEHFRVELHLVVDCSRGSLNDLLSALIGARETAA